VSSWRWFASVPPDNAIFLILELNQPFSGLFRLPSTSIEQTIAAL
jgi:hypothetical protein